MQDLDYATKMFLNTMLKQQNGKLGPKYITYQDMISKFHKWPERTTTSPSNLHLGHWKVLTTEYKVDESQDEFNHKQRAIMQLHIDLINYCLKWGYSLERWQKIVTCMIFKEPGNIKIHRLRVIHIYEADLSAVLGIKWRHLTHELLKRKFFHPGLSATVPTRTVHDLVLNTVLQCKFARLT